MGTADEFPAQLEPEVQRLQCYVTARDGVKLATDVFLPVGLYAGERRPCLLHRTPYCELGDPWARAVSLL